MGILKRLHKRILLLFPQKIFKYLNNSLLPFEAKVLILLENEVEKPK